MQIKDLTNKGIEIGLIGKKEKIFMKIKIKN